ncbi:MAG: DUF805 domain-containing protein [Patescibacteria group bacterium]|nr:DUF805 domain-containing protein [Patescibacteria group bacterium]
MNWYIEVLKKYVVFKGRAGRREFWMFVLFNLIISLVLSLIEGLFSDDTSILSGIYSLAILLPSLAVGVRRLHDTNRSAWWLLLLLIPIIGPIVLIVFYALEGDKAANQYGPVPPTEPAKTKK